MSLPPFISSPQTFCKVSFCTTDGHSGHRPDSGAREEQEVVKAGATGHLASPWAARDRAGSPGLRLGWGTHVSETRT